MRKALSLILAWTLFFTNCALVHSAEKNFWADRQKQFARLPTPLKEIPLVGATRWVAQPELTISKWTRHLGRGTASPLHPLIQSIPLTHGRIQEVYDSKNFDQNPVIILQDVHLNHEAQINIAAIIQHMIDEDSVSVVGVEGAFDVFDFSRYRAFPDKTITQTVADAFLNKNLISAPGFVGLTSPKELPHFIGIDDPHHYQANVDAYLSTRHSIDRIRGRLLKERRTLMEKKKTILSGDLKRFVDLKEAYHKNQVGMGAYVRNLDSFSSQSDWVTQQFLEAYELELTLDFDRVAHERSLVLEKLTSKLDETELQNLVTRSVAYKMGSISFGDYYGGLKALLQSEGISLRQTPQFDDYIRYVLLSDGINVQALLKSVRQLENDIENKLAQTEEEKAILNHLTQLALKEKLTAFALTPGEWEKYKSLLRGRDAETQQRSIAASFEEFYNQAQFRSEKMVENLLGSRVQSLEFSKAKLLVTGGFHTPDIATLLREKEVSYVVVSPKITKIDSSEGSSYLSIFAREKTPLDELFEGKKLFINPSQVAGFATPAAPKVNALARLWLAALHQQKTGDDGDEALEAEEQPDNKVRLRSTDGNLDVTVKTDMDPSDEEAIGLPVLSIGLTLSLWWKKLIHRFSKKSEIWVNESARELRNIRVIVLDWNTVSTSKGGLEFLTKLTEAPFYKGFKVILVGHDDTEIESAKNELDDLGILHRINTIEKRTAESGDIGGIIENALSGVHIDSERPVLYISNEINPASSVPTSKTITMVVSEDPKTQREQKRWITDYSIYNFEDPGIDTLLSFITDNTEPAPLREFLRERENDIVFNNTIYSARDFAKLLLQMSFENAYALYSALDQNGNNIDDVRFYLGMVFDRREQKKILKIEETETHIQMNGGSRMTPEAFAAELMGSSALDARIFAFRLMALDVHYEQVYQRIESEMRRRINHILFIDKAAFTIPRQKLNSVKKRNNPALNAQQETLFSMGEEYGIAANGVRDISSLIAIILDGKVADPKDAILTRGRYGQVMHAGNYGDTFVVFDDHFNDTLYVVPEESDRQYIHAVLEMATRDLGVHLEPREARAIMARVVTYADFVNAQSEIQQAITPRRSNGATPPGTGNRAVQIIREQAQISRQDAGWNYLPVEEKTLDADPSGRHPSMANVDFVRNQVVRIMLGKKFYIEIIKKNGDYMIRIIDQAVPNFVLDEISISADMDELILGRNHQKLFKSDPHISREHIRIVHGGANALRIENISKSNKIHLSYLESPSRGDSTVAMGIVILLIAVGSLFWGKEISGILIAGILPFFNKWIGKKDQLSPHNKTPEGDDVARFKINDAIISVKENGVVLFNTEFDIITSDSDRAAQMAALIGRDDKTPFLREWLQSLEQHHTPEDVVRHIETLQYELETEIPFDVSGGPLHRHKPTPEGVVNVRSLVAAHTFRRTSRRRYRFSQNLRGLIRYFEINRKSLLDDIRINPYVKTRLDTYENQATEKAGKILGATYVRQVFVIEELLNRLILVIGRSGYSYTQNTDNPILTKDIEVAVETGFLSHAYNPRLVGFDEDVINLNYYLTVAEYWLTQGKNLEVVMDIVQNMKERRDYMSNGPAAHFDRIETGINQFKIGKGVLGIPLWFSKNKWRQAVWNYGFAPGWEEALFTGVGLSLVALTGQAWIYVAARIIFTLLHLVIGNTGPPSFENVVRNLTIPTLISLTLLYVIPFQSPIQLSDVDNYVFIAFGLHSIGNIATTVLNWAIRQYGGFFQFRLGSILNKLVQKEITQKDIQDLLDAELSLVFTEHPQVVDRLLFEEANRTGQAYIRIRLRDQDDLDRVEVRSWSAEDGEFKTEEGPLFEIIRAGGIIFIDYDGSDPKLVETLNSLFDEKPYYDSIQAPNIKIVGAMSGKKYVKYPVSFYSRFRKTIVRNPDYKQSIPLHRPSDLIDDDAEIVDMFESPQIMDLLVGRHYLDEAGLMRFEEGALVRAVKSGKPLVIQGGDWGDPNLVDFIDQIMTNRKFEANGQSLSVPENFIYIEDRDYVKGDFSNKEIILSGSVDSKDRIWVINRENQDILFNRTEIKAPQMTQTSGLLSQDKLRLRITDDLPKWVWHRIMHSENEISIEIDPNVRVPSVYRKHVSFNTRSDNGSRQEISWDEAMGRKSILIQSDDLGYILARIEAGTPKEKTVVIDVTPDMSLDQLVSSIEVDTNNSGERSFKSHSQKLVNALEAGSVVVLNGIDANMSLMRSLESLLQDNPYLMENNKDRSLAEFGNSRIIMTSRQKGMEGPHPQKDREDRKDYEKLLTRTKHVVLNSSAKRLVRVLKLTTKHFNSDNFEKIMRLRDIFNTLSNPPHFSFNRIRRLFEYEGNWIEAFEDVFISQYSDSPEVVAFMRTMVRLEFNEEDLGRSANTVAWNKLKPILDSLVPGQEKKALFWQFADSLSVDILEGLRIPRDYNSATNQSEVFDLVGEALVAHHTGIEAEYYRSRFGVLGVNPDAAKIDESTQAGKPNWETQKKRVVKALDKFNFVFLRGSPGTGKSFITNEVAKELGFMSHEIEGPITVGADTPESEVLEARTFDGTKTIIDRDKAIQRWLQGDRGLLIVDEANLTHPYFWNMIRGHINENRKVIFTGNQESVVGRQRIELIEELAAVIHFNEFDDEFIHRHIGTLLDTNKSRFIDLQDNILSVFKLIRQVAREKPFSLRDVQELVARVNTLMESDLSDKDLVKIAWTQFRGVLDPVGQQALRHLFVRKFGFDVQQYEDEIHNQLKEKKEHYGQFGIALVHSAAWTAHTIKEFLKVRQARMDHGTLIRGKRGIIFEGQSGRGKDRILMAALEDAGFKEARDAPEGWDPQLTYYHINARLNYDDMFNLIETAKQNGSIVIVSELNLLPSNIIEGKMNDVLAGNDDVRDLNDGFAFHSTINSEEFGGREMLSSALQNRVIYTVEEDYSQTEYHAMIDTLYPDVKKDMRHTLVNAHVWIRDQIEDVRYQPTTRDLRRALEQDGTFEGIIREVYGPLYLTYIIDPDTFPTSLELLRYKEKPRVSNELVAKRLGNSLAYRPGHPFQFGTHTRDQNSSAGFSKIDENLISILADLIQTDQWQLTFFHELSHLLFTRHFSVLSISGDDPFDPLYQDLEDLRHLNAFQQFFESTELNAPGPAELEMARIIQEGDDDALFNWMSDKEKPINLRQAFQYVVSVTGKGLVTVEQLDVMAQIVEGVFEVNPFQLGVTHYERIHQIKASIPETLNENDVQLAQFKAMVLMHEMRDDFINIPDELIEVPESINESEKEALVENVQAKMNQEAAAPAQLKKSVEKGKVQPVKVLAKEDIEKKKEKNKKRIKKIRREIGKQVAEGKRDQSKPIKLPRVGSFLKWSGIALSTVGILYSIYIGIRTYFLPQSSLPSLPPSGDDVDIPSAPDLQSPAEEVDIPSTPDLPSPAEEVDIPWPWEMDWSLPTNIDFNFEMVIISLVFSIVLSVVLTIMLRLFGPVETFEVDGDGNDIHGNEKGQKKEAQVKIFESTKDINPIVRYPIFRQKKINKPIFDDAVSRNQSEFEDTAKDFVEVRQVPDRVYGPPEGAITNILRFYQNPSRGFSKSSGTQQEFKKKIIINAHNTKIRNAPKEEKADRLAIREAIVQFLVSQGHEIYYTTVENVPDKYVREIGRADEVEMIASDDLQVKFEGIFLYEAFMQAMPISFDQQVATAKQLIQDIGGDPNDLRRFQSDDKLALILTGLHSFDLKRLSGLSQLTILSLSGNQVRDIKEPFSLNHQPRVYLNDFTLKDLAQIHLWESLEELHLSDTNIMFDEIEKIAKSHPNPRFKIHVGGEIAAQSVPARPVKSIDEKELEREQYHMAEEFIEIVKTQHGTEDSLAMHSFSRGIGITISGYTGNLDPLRTVTRLFRLSLEDVSIDALDPIQFSKLKFLTIKNNSSGKFDNLDALKSMQNLEMLELSGVPLISEEDVFDLLLSHPNPALQIIFNLKRYRRGDVPRKYARAFQEKQNKMSVEWQMDVLDDLSKHMDMDVNQYNPNIWVKVKDPDFFQTTIFENMDAITQLDLSGTLAINLDPLVGSNITFLNIDRTPTFNYDILLRLLGMPKLEYVTVSESVSKEIIEKILLDHPNKKLKIIQGMKEYTRDQPDDANLGINKLKKALKKYDNKSRAKIVTYTDVGLGADLSHLPIIDVEFLSPFQNIREMDITETKLSDLSPLYSSPVLEKLTMSGNEPFDWKSLVQFENLSEINLAGYADYEKTGFFGLGSSPQVDIRELYDLLIAHPNKKLTIKSPRGDLTYSRIPRDYIRQGIPFHRDGGPHIVIFSDQMKMAKAMRKRVDGLWVHIDDVKENIVLSYKPGSTEGDLLGINSVKNLYYLSLPGTQMTNVDLLINNINVNTLDLSKSQVVDIRGLRYLKNLEVLDISGSRVRRIRSLEHATQLKKVILYDTNVQDISPLFGLPITYLHRNSHVSADQIRDLIKHHPNPDSLMLLSPFGKLEKNEDYYYPTLSFDADESAISMNLLRAMRRIIIKLGPAVGYVQSQFINEGRENDMKVIVQMIEQDPPLANMLDRRLRQKEVHKNHPIAYLLYAILFVNVENLILAASTALLPNVGGLLLGAFVFSLMHYLLDPEWTWSSKRFFYYFSIGFTLIGLPFVFTDSLMMGFLISSLFHTLHNYVLIVLDHVDRLPDWLGFEIEDEYEGIEMPKELIKFIYDAEDRPRSHDAAWEWIGGEYLDHILNHAGYGIQITGEYRRYVRKNLGNAIYEMVKNAVDAIRPSLDTQEVDSELLNNVRVFLRKDDGGNLVIDVLNKGEIGFGKKDIDRLRKHRDVLYVIQAIAEEKEMPALETDVLDVFDLNELVIHRRHQEQPREINLKRLRQTIRNITHILHRLENNQKVEDRLIFALISSNYFSGKLQNFMGTYLALSSEKAPRGQVEIYPLLRRNAGVGVGEVFRGLTVSGLDGSLDMETRNGWTRFSMTIPPQHINFGTLFNTDIHMGRTLPHPYYRLFLRLGSLNSLHHKVVPPAFARTDNQIINSEGVYEVDLPAPLANPVRDNPAFHSSLLNYSQSIEAHKDQLSGSQGFTFKPKRILVVESGIGGDFLTTATSWKRQGADPNTVFHVRVESADTAEAMGRIAHQLGITKKNIEIEVMEDRAWLPTKIKTPYDLLVWNMPAVRGQNLSELETLENFSEVVPSLLTPNGAAIVQNGVRVVSPQFVNVHNVLGQHMRVTNNAQTENGTGEIYVLTQNPPLNEGSGRIGKLDPVVLEPLLSRKSSSESPLLFPESMNAVGATILENVGLDDVVLPQIWRSLGYAAKELYRNGVQIENPSLEGDIRTGAGFKETRLEFVMGEKPGSLVMKVTNKSQKRPRDLVSKENLVKLRLTLNRILGIIEELPQSPVMVSGKRYQFALNPKYENQLKEDHAVLRNTLAEVDNAIENIDQLSNDDLFNLMKLKYFSVRDARALIKAYLILKGENNTLHLYESNEAIRPTLGEGLYAIAIDAEKKGMIFSMTNDGEETTFSLEIPPKYVELAVLAKKKIPAVQALPEGVLDRTILEESTKGQLNYLPLMFVFNDSVWSFIIFGAFLLFNQVKQGRLPILRSWLWQEELFKARLNQIMQHHRDDLRSRQLQLIQHFNQGPLSLGIGHHTAGRSFVNALAEVNEPYNGYIGALNGLNATLDQTDIVGSWVETEDQVRQLMKENPGRKLRLGTFNSNLTDQFHSDLIEFVVRSPDEKTTVLDLIQENDSKLHFLFLNDVELPAEFFDVDWDFVSRVLAVYIVTSTLYAIEIPGSHLPSWIAHREALISA